MSVESIIVGLRLLKGAKANASLQVDKASAVDPLSTNSEQAETAVFISFVCIENNRVAATVGRS